MIVKTTAYLCKCLCSQVFPVRLQHFARCAHKPDTRLFLRSSWNCWRPGQHSPPVADNICWSGMLGAWDTQWTESARGSCRTGTQSCSPAAGAETPGTTSCNCPSQKIRPCIWVAVITVVQLWQDIAHHWGVSFSLFTLYSLITLYFPSVRNWKCICKRKELIQLRAQD